MYYLKIGEKMEEKFMKEALKEAKKAYNKLEVPVGAVIVKDGQIIARAHNLKESKKDTTKHAEILLNVLEDYPFNNKVEYKTGILKEECENILQEFFKELRKNKK